MKNNLKMHIRINEQLVNVVPIRKWMLNNAIADAMHKGHAVILYMALFHFHYMG